MGAETEIFDVICKPQVLQVDAVACPALGLTQSSQDEFQDYDMSLYRGGDLDGPDTIARLDSSVTIMVVRAYSWICRLISCSLKATESIWPSVPRSWKSGWIARGGSNHKDDKVCLSLSARNSINYWTCRLPEEFVASCNFGGYRPMSWRPFEEISSSMQTDHLLWHLPYLLKVLAAEVASDREQLMAELQIFLSLSCWKKEF